MNCNGNMEFTKNSRHFYSVELTNDERLEAAALMVALRDEGLIPFNTNMGQFMKECFARGFNDYRKDLLRND